MRLTKYEYTHNKHGDRKVDRLGAYFPPIARIVTISIIYIYIVFLLIDILFYNRFTMVNNFIHLSLVLIFSVLVLEYNPFFFISFIIRIIIYIFLKNSNHKKLVYYLLKDYRNIVDFEKQVGISNVKISFFNPIKISFKKSNKKGYISLKKIKVGNTYFENEYHSIENEKKYIMFLKEMIKNLYKETKQKV